MGPKGTAMERLPGAFPVKGSGRAYSIALSHEQSNAHIHPAMSMKTDRGRDLYQSPPTADQPGRNMRLKLIKASLSSLICAHIFNILRF